MMSEQQFLIKEEAKITLGIIGIKVTASKQSKIQRKRVEISLEPRKVKYFSFIIFYDKIELGKKSRDNIVATKKIHI